MKCPRCQSEMDWFLCMDLDCVKGLDTSDCLGLRKCHECDGEGGYWECDCRMDDDQFEDD